MKERKERWQFQFADATLRDKHNNIIRETPPVLLGARRNGRGEWIEPDKLPEYVRSYLAVGRGKQYWHYNDAHNTAEMRQQIDAHGLGRVKWNPALCNPVRLAGTVQIDSPPAPPKPRRIPKSVPAIRNLQDLCDHFGADEPRLLNKRLYKDTDCGASISVQTPDDKWHHNGTDWTGITEIKSFTIQTIVEGSEATVDSVPFDLPVTVKEVEEWMEEMEAESSRLWNRDNATYYTVLDKDKNPLFYCKWTEGYEEPEGSHEPEQQDLAVKAGEVLFGDSNPGATYNRGGWKYPELPIPGIEYFVQERDCDEE
jgi:hypothetical protein